MSLNALNFLIAEDHDFQRQSTARLLSHLGAKTVHEAADGHHALAVMANPECSVDVVICDLDMPSMDGMELIRRLSQLEAKVSVILSSALELSLVASVEKMAKAYGIELLGVIEKPITAGKLEPLLKRREQINGQRNRPVAKREAYTLEQILAGLANDEFEPFFQPKLDLASGKVCGAEALARWRHPGDGIVPPSEFIGVLEDSGNIAELMWVMLKKSAAQCSAWRAQGHKSSVSVNLSPNALVDERLAERITAVVTEQGLQPRDMVLELTEAAATTDVGQALENLARLRMRGFGLSIDDYGTGYSSMQQLSRIAFTELKIDQSFVTNASLQESARAILESCLVMARKLNISAVAEGVETQEDWDLLRALGCDQAQGFFIAKGMEADVYHQWLNTFPDH